MAYSDNLVHRDSRTTVLCNLWPPTGQEPPREPGDEPHTGTAELVVPNWHATSMEGLTFTQFKEWMLIVSERTRAASRWESVCVFVNAGVAVGQSQPHLHAQVVGLDHRPPQQLLEEGPGECRVCAARDHAHDTRWLSADGRAWAAFAPLSMGEVQLAPPHGGDAFDEGTLRALKDTLSAFGSTFGRVSYSLVAHLPARSHDVHPHWHILPRMGGSGAYNLGYGMSVSGQDPAVFASKLRGI